MTSLNISLPEPLREWIETQINRGRYGNASECLRDLIRRDQERQARERLEDLLVESMKSGPASPWTKREWAELRTDLAECLEKRRGGRVKKSRWETPTGARRPGRLRNLPRRGKRARRTGVPLPRRSVRRESQRRVERSLRVGTAGAQSRNAMSASALSVNGCAEWSAGSIPAVSTNDLGRSFVLRSNRWRPTPPPDSRGYLAGDRPQ